MPLNRLRIIEIGAAILWVGAALLLVSSISAKPLDPTLPLDRVFKESFDTLMQHEPLLKPKTTEKPEELARRFLALAQQGNPSGQFGLAVIYEYGYGLPKNLPEALQWYQKAADQGLPAAQNRMGVMFDLGEGISKDSVEAVHWYERAAVKGFPPAQFNLGLAKTLGTGTATNYTEALAWFQKAADNGYPGAFYQVGVAYLKGRAVETNQTEAVKWFHKAAELDVPPAIGRIALSYREKKDDETAARWAERGAKLGDFMSQWVWSCLLDEGKIVPRNQGEAFRWKRLAAQQGFTPAADELG